MPINRRDLLVGGAALAASCTSQQPASNPPQPSPDRDPTPAAPSPNGEPDTDRFPWGVVVAEVTAGSALVRVRAVDVDALTLVVQRHDGEEWVNHRTHELVREGSTHPAVLTDLVPDTPYAVWAVAGSRSRVTRFRTAPVASTGRRIRIGATSCLAFANEDLANLTWVGDHDLDVFLMLGDAVYADGSNTLEDYRESWSEHFQRPAMGDLFAATSILSIWDDHEVENNWTLESGSSRTIPPQKLRHARIAMQETLPQRTGPDGFYRTHRWGQDLELFLFDCRADRTPNGITSDAQMDWMVERIQRSTARFKIVLTSVHLTDHFSLFSTIEVVDRWQGYPAQRAQLVSALANTPGTLVLTGDMHFGSVQTLDPDGVGADVVEIAAGPSGSFLAPVGLLVDLIGEQPAQYDILLEDWSWCRLDLDPATGEVIVQFIGNEGQVLAAQTFVVPMEIR